MHIRYLAVLLVFLVAPAQADWYRVEVILFDRRFPNTDGEFLQGQPRLQQPKNSIELVAPELESNTPIPYQVLPDDQCRLRPIYRALEMAKNNRPLLHSCWRQPVASRHNTKAVRLFKFIDAAPAEGAVTDDQVFFDALIPVANGFIKVSSGHFLYIDIDFIYYPGRSFALNTDVDRHPDHHADYVRLKNRRKIKLNELHYFDHPLFGIILQVSRLKEQKD